MSYSRKQSDVKAARSEKDRAAVRVSAVVRVLDFYPDSMTVDVQPLVKEKIDGQYASAAPIMGLRAATLCAGEYIIRPWYNRGDIGMVVTGDYDADAVFSTGQESEPNTARNHAPEDGIFIGGVCPSGKAPKGLPSQALVLAAGSGAAYVALKSDKILIKGDVEIEGNVKISDLLEADGIEMTTHTHTGDSGGSTSEPHRTEG